MLLAAGVAWRQSPPGQFEREFQREHDSRAPPDPIVPFSPGVYAFAAALTRKYRNDGYVLSQAVLPHQAIRAGGPPGT